MLDLKKIEIEATKLIQSITREEFLKWDKFDRKRMSVAKKNNGVFQEPYITYNGYLAYMEKMNGSPQKAAKSKVAVRKKKAAPIEN